jgi:hypothetical protein
MKLPTPIKVPLNDIVEARYFGSCSIIKLANPALSIPKQNTRMTLTAHDNERAGMKSVRIISMLSRKIAGMIIFFRPVRFISRPAVSPDAAAGVYCGYY